MSEWAAQESRERSSQSMPLSPQSLEGSPRLRRRWGGLRIFRRDKASVVAAVLIVAIGMLALLAPVVAPYDPAEQRIVRRLQPPLSPRHWLGTDDFGRDVWSRVVWGSRVSLVVGAGSVLLGMLLGTPVGLVAGYRGGRLDQMMMRLVDVLMSFPMLVLGLMVAGVLGPGQLNLVIAIGVSMAPRFARMARGTALALRSRDFVEAARAIGNSESRIITRHLLPNVLGQLVVMATLWMATAIRAEANLSFIGLGAPPPNPTWGGMIRDGLNLLGTAPWISVVPGIAIFVTVLAFNMLGDGLRDAIDPRFRDS